MAFLRSLRLGKGIDCDLAQLIAVQLFQREASYGQTTGNAFSSYLLYELGNGAGHAFGRRGSGNGDSTAFRSHGCSADERTRTIQPGFNSGATTNNHRSTDSDHNQGCRRKYAEYASVTRHSWFTLANTRKQSADESVRANGTVSAFVGDVDIRREWEREPEFDDSGFEQSGVDQPDQFRFNDSRFDQSNFNHPSGSESSE